jgi:hypothetical protein
MRHWKKLALLLVAPLAASLLLAILTSDSEPSYQGAPLRWWIVYPSTMKSPEVVHDALLHMGTNALPLLVKWACYTPPRWRRSLLNLCAKYPKVTPTKLSVWAYNPEFRALGAAGALWFLGTNAYPALAQLNLIAANAQDTNKADRAVKCTFLILYPGVISQVGSDPQFTWVARHGRGTSGDLATLKSNLFRDPNPVIRQAATNTHRMIQ